MKTIATVLITFFYLHSPAHASTFQHTLITNSGGFTIDLLFSSNDITSNTTNYNHLTGTSILTITDNSSTDTFTFSNVLFFNVSGTAPGPISSFAVTASEFITDDSSSATVDFLLSSQNFSSALLTHTGLFTISTPTRTETVDSFNTISTNFTPGSTLITTPSPVPVPAAIWLMASGLFSLLGLSRKKKQHQQSVPA